MGNNDILARRVAGLYALQGRRGVRRANVMERVFEEREALRGVLGGDAEVWGDMLEYWVNQNILTHRQGVFYYRGRPLGV